MPRQLVEVIGRDGHIIESHVVDLEHEFQPPIGRLRRLYVLPDARRQGVGRALVRRLEFDAMPHFTRLVLRTDSDAAARFYEALGYERLPAGGSATHARALA